MMSCLLYSTCLRKSWMIRCSDTWEPMGNRFFSCLSILRTSSWSPSEVNPSAPACMRQCGRKGECEGGTQTPRDVNSPVREPDMAASRVETRNSRRASSTWLARAKGERDNLARASAILIIASSCRTVMGMAVLRAVSLSCWRAPPRIIT